MNRSRRRGIAIAAVVASSVCTLAFGLLSLTGFSSSGSGDLTVSSTPAASVALVFVGLLLVIELEWSHLSRRSHRAARAPLTERVRI
jgi:hypothetical protein